MNSATRRKRLRVTSALLAILLIFALAACNAKPSPSESQPTAFIAARGEWKDYPSLPPLDGVVADAAGKTYAITADKRVAATSPDGTEQLLPELGDYMPLAVTNIGDGVSVLVVNLNMDTELLDIDTGSMRFGESHTLPHSAIRAYYGGGVYDALLDDGAIVYGCKFGGKAERLFSWVSVGIAGESVRGVAILDPETIFVNSNGELYRLKLGAVSNDIPKITLTLACFGDSSDVAAQIEDFNAANIFYKIVPTYYSSGYDPVTRNFDTSAVMKFNTEVITGKIPDLIVTYSSFPLDTYIKKGVLADLYPLLDADAELGGRSAVLPDILRASELDGKLYQLSKYFALDVVIAPSDALGGKTSWTCADAMELLARRPDGTVIVSNTNQIAALGAVLYDFVDYSNATCSFDSPEFLDTLRFAKTYPSKVSVSLDLYSPVTSGKAIAAHNIMFADFQSHQTAKMSLGGDIEYIGFPGRSNNYISLSSGVSISAACQYKDAAWEFVRTYIADDGSSEFMSFPTSASAFARMESLAMEKELDKDGKELPKRQMDIDGVTVDVFALTQADIDAVNAVIARAVKTMADYPLQAIASSETAAFFAGEKSAEDTARAIQSRVSLYLSEQYG